MSPVAVGYGVGVSPVASVDTIGITPPIALGEGHGIRSGPITIIELPVDTVIAFGPPFGIGSQPVGIGPYGSQGINF